MDGLALPETTRPGGVAGIDREPFELFLIHEGRLLDERRFEDWMALFTDDGLYWVPSTPDQTDPYQQASLFFDDRELMKTRIDRLRHPRIHIQTPPSRTNHMVSNVIIEEADAAAGVYLVSSSMMMSECRLDIQRHFSGRQFHRLEKDGDSFRIRLKRVQLINCDSPFEAMAVPI
ncbi:MAG: aromatic-ring-hydroxylating dioxygenase subunit beta [Rhodospirillaceae bacterium]|jgi:benzoate/toluate 1,2-dioxygenase beta subunit|nr:aromatic-ring-hydroxylating dioxygenase subunit beta [Rhodospirillaceae bacterium]